MGLSVKVLESVVESQAEIISALKAAKKNREEDLMGKCLLSDRALCIACEIIAGNMSWPVLRAELEKQKNEISAMEDEESREVYSEALRALKWSFRDFLAELEIEEEDLGLEDSDV
jgi:3-oxoacyl-[acyl-carrier-protein] synthase III